MRSEEDMKQRRLDAARESAERHDEAFEWNKLRADRDRWRSIAEELATSLSSDVWAYRNPSAQQNAYAALAKFTAAKEGK